MRDPCALRPALRSAALSHQGVPREHTLGGRLCEQVGAPETVAQSLIQFTEVISHQPLIQVLPARSQAGGHEARCDTPDQKHACPLQSLHVKHSLVSRVIN